MMPCAFTIRFALWALSFAAMFGIAAPSFAQQAPPAAVTPPAVATPPSAEEDKATTTSAPSSEPTRGWLGIYTLPLSPVERAELKVSSASSLVIVGVYPNSPAEAAGLEVGDVLVSSGGTPKNSEEGASKESSAESPDSSTPKDKLTIIYERAGQRATALLDRVTTPSDLEQRTRLIAELGTPWAQYEMAQMAVNGDEPDLAQAREWLRQAAEQELAIAQLELGLMLLEGVGGKADPAQGRRWLERAAVQRLPAAFYSLGLVHHRGIGVKQDPATAIKLYRAAAKAGDHRAEFELGCLCEMLKPPDHKTALEWLSRAAQGGVIEANSRIAVLFQNGWGVPKNDAEAFRYFLRAAHGGDVVSQFIVGVMCQEGTGVPVDKATALHWLTVAANNGEPRAMNGLGLIYQLGEGVPANSETAAKWFRLSAESGNVAAAYNLALLCDALKQPADALQWYRLAAEGGLPDAQHKLGSLYADGTGVKQDRAEAVIWHLKAALQGHKAAQESVRQLVAVANAKPPASTTPK